MSYDEDKAQKKRRRCYHRALSGLERGGGRIRFITLTSTPTSPPDIQRSWRKLIMRLKRRGLVSGYIKVPEYTKSGLVHYHVLTRGSYIEQLLLSHMWAEIHGAPVVDIRQVQGFESRSQVAGYVAKYMSKESAGRYSWDWGWCWKGFVKDWTRLKRAAWTIERYTGREFFSHVIPAWQRWLRKNQPPPFDLWTEQLDQVGITL